MISFDGFHEEDGTPVYVQIIRHIKRGVAAGTVVHGDELPSRRVLSARLGVNPNTVQKAYRVMEEEGLIRSHSGAKSFMVLEDGAAERIREELTEREVRALAVGMKRAGLSLERAIRLLERVWKEAEETE